MTKHQEIIDLYRVWDDLWGDDSLDFLSKYFDSLITEAELKLEESCHDLLRYDAIDVLEFYNKQGWID